MDPGMPPWCSKSFSPFSLTVALLGIPRIVSRGGPFNSIVAAAGHSISTSVQFKLNKASCTPAGIFPPAVGVTPQTEKELNATNGRLAWRRVARRCSPIPVSHSHPATMHGDEQGGWGVGGGSSWIRQHPPGILNIVRRKPWTRKGTRQGENGTRKG